MNEPILTGHKGFKVRGPNVRTSNADEATVRRAQIPDLWKRYLEAGGPTSITGALDAPVTIAVYTHYDSDHTGMYTLLVGAPLVSSDGGNKLEHKTCEVPDGSYLLFEGTGEMPQALIDTWQRIYAYFDGDVPYARTYQADFEIHDGSTPDRVEVYVGVR